MFLFLFVSTAKAMTDFGITLPSMTTCCHEAGELSNSLFIYSQWLYASVEWDCMTHESMKLF